MWKKRKALWNRGKALAACTFAAAWWSVFYPELCFTEDTCEAVRTEEADGTFGKTEAGKVDGFSEKFGSGIVIADEAAGTIEAGEVWNASGDSLVISSKFLEWCRERLTAEKE